MMKSLLLSLLLAGSSLAQTATLEPEVDMLWGVKIPLRDGVRLNATVFKPKSMPASLPTVFTLTPYIADSYQDRAD